MRSCAMALTHVDSGGKGYTIEKSSRGLIVRRRDSGIGYTWGTQIGSVKTLEEALSVIKSDSGSNSVRIR